MASQGRNRADSIALNEAIQAVQSSAELIGSLMGDIKDNAVISATLKSEVQTLKGEVRGISSILTDGSSGVRPLRTRVGLLESQTESFCISIQDLRKTLEQSADKANSKQDLTIEKQVGTCMVKFEDVKNKLSLIEKKLDLMDLDRELKLERIKGRWQLYVALATGVIAFLGFLLTYLDKYLG